MLSLNGQLVLHVDKPEAILGLTTAARVHEVKGKRLIVLPHDADSVKLLRNIGLNPPPIKLDGFKYPGRFKPFDHQRICVEFLVVTKRGFNLSDPGTGKTAAALWAAEYLRLKGKVRRVLIGCPLSVLSVWEDEAFNILPHRSFVKLTGTKQRRLDLLGKGSDICVINHDGITTIHEELANAKFDLIILDEASAYKNAQTRRYKLFRELAKKTPYLWLLTGTPVTKAPTDAYGLIKMVNPASFPGGFVLFKEQTMTKVGNFKWIPKSDSKEFVYRHMQPAVRFKKKDCIDLPPIMYVNRTCDMTAEQTKAFSLMKKQMVMEQNSGEKITAANAAVKLLKLIQICCGVVKDNKGEHYILDASTRLNALEEVVEESGGKAIIFIPYIGVMEAVQKFLDKQGWSTGLVNGSVSEKERSKIFDDFQRGTLELLIAHPRTAAHGLNLTASHTIIWYGPIFSSEQYIQANARIDRAGQKNKMTVYHIISSPIEAAIYRALWGQVMMSNTILEQYEGMLR